MLPIVIGAVVGIFLAILLLIWKLPAKVQYLERIVVKAPAAKVYDAIRYQEQLMEWSAWPSETNSLCEVNNEDGVVGAQTIYQNQKGKKFGYQEVIELEKDRKVSFYLKSYVAPFEENVNLKFILHPLSAMETEVALWFDEKLKKPQFLIAYFGNIISWVHEMHLKDLAGLKKYAEKK